MVKINICLHYYCVLHWKQGIDRIFSFQISLHMGRRWGPYGHTHMGLPSHIPYGTNMGFIWAFPSGFAQSHPIWDQYGVYMGMPIWACPVVAHMGPILSCLLGSYPYSKFGVKRPKQMKVIERKLNFYF